MWIKTTQDIVHAEFDQTFMDINVDAPDAETHQTVVHIF